MSDVELFPDFEFDPKPKPKPDPWNRVELYRLIAEVRELEPWKVLENEDLIGFNSTNDPQKLHLISVLGSAGEYFAIQLHYPPKGIRFYNQILNGTDVDAGPGMENVHSIDCEFADSGQASPEDISALADYGNPTKKEKSIPSLSTYRPGLLPWTLDKKDIEDFIFALQLFLKFYPDIANKVDDLYTWDEADEMPTIPVLSLKKNGKSSRLDDWEMKTGQIPIYAEPAAIFPASDGFDSVYEQREVKDEVWEIGCTWLPDPVEDGEESDRPWFPRIVAAMHDDPAGMVLVKPDLFPGYKVDDWEAIQKFFRKFSDYRECLPSEVRVTNENDRLALQAIADKIGFKVSIEEQEYLSDFFDSFTGQDNASLRQQVDEALSILPPGDPIRKMLLDGNYEEAFAALGALMDENAENIIVGDFGGEN